MFCNGGDLFWIDDRAGGRVLMSDVKTIVLEGFKLHSANVLRRKYRSPFAYKKYRTDIEWLIQVQCMGLMAESTERKHVAITRYYAKPERAYDYDNLVAGCKPVLDALTKQGVIHDDSPRWIDLMIKQELADEGRLEIVIGIDDE